MMKKFNMHASTAQRLRALFLILCVSLIAACSSIKFAYNNGDTLLYWWMDGYVDLDSSQSALVKKDIDKLFRWHRQTQLRDYAKLLTNGQKQLAGNLTQADLLRDYQEIKQGTELLLNKALPELAEVARTIRPEQIATLEKKFAKNNNDYRKKFMQADLAKRHKARYEKTLEQFEFWFGSFSRDQEAIIRKASDARPVDNEIWLEERMRRQQLILSMLRKVQAEKLSKEATIAQVQLIVKDTFDRLESPERKAFYDAYIDTTSKLILQVAAIATPTQKAHAHKRMQSWIDDFNTLAADTR
jgi:hypothetical protein